MKCFLKMLVVLLGLSTTAVLHADDAVVAAEKKAANVQAKLSTEDLSKQNRLFIYSKVELLKPSIFRNGSWTLMETSPKHETRPDIHIYGTKYELALRDGDKVSLSAVRPDGSRFIDDAVVSIVDDKVSIEIVNRENLSAEELKKRQEEIAAAAAAAAKAQKDLEASWWGAPDASTGRFMQLLNNYRMSNGLSAVNFDGNMAYGAYLNNINGGRHAVQGHGHQNWAGSGNPDGAFNMWVNSSGHRANMLLNGATRAGINFWGNHATLNIGR